MFSYYSELIGAATAAAVDRDAALVVAPPSSRGWFVWDRVALDGVIVIDPMVGDPCAPGAPRARAIPFVTAGRDPSVTNSTRSWRLGRPCLDTRRPDAPGGAAARERVALVTIPPVISYIRDTVAAYEAWCDEQGQHAARRDRRHRRPGGALGRDPRAMVDEALAGPDAPTRSSLRSSSWAWRSTRSCWRGASRSPTT